MENPSDLATDSSENVFILQLESGNALAAQGKLSNDGKGYPGLNAMPELTELAKDGVFFPLFWSNAFPTNRAQEVILCGLIRQMGRAFSLHPEDIESTCLPEMLRSSGYRTIVFRSDDLTFLNMGEFLSHIGFDEVHQEDIMRPGDKKWDWGYDDCTFYKRAFEYLGKHYPRGEKLFVYFEVSSHHPPFRTKPPYELAHPFKRPQDALERYLNSLSEQDLCVATFYDEFKKYAPDNTHLFVHPDHSVPIARTLTDGNRRGSFSNEFLVPMAYVPPRSRADEFRTGVTDERIFAQSDEIATIFDLLNGKRVGNSFADALRRKPVSRKPYENCHILTQSYKADNRSVMIVDGTTFRSYTLRTHTMSEYDLTKDLLTEYPVKADVPTSSTAFFDEYLCPRYRTTETMDVRVHGRWARSSSS